jgi:hypothetical protein
MMPIMNNRQAALLAAASSVTDSMWGKSVTKGEVARRVVTNSQAFEYWLNERDLAEEEGRLPATFDFILTMAEGGYERFEKAYQYEVSSFHLADDGRSVVVFANGIQIKLASGAAGSEHEVLKDVARLLRSDPHRPHDALERAPAHRGHVRLRTRLADALLDPDVDPVGEVDAGLIRDHDRDLRWRRAAGRERLHGALRVRVDRP